jgi:hypothetical protein
MPDEIYLRFYEELNDYLPANRRKREFAYSVDGPMTLGNLLKVQGVPDSEVEFVLVNGRSVDLFYVLEPGDRVSVYPVFESLDVRTLVKFRTVPLRRLQFLLTPDLCRLASSLCSLGFNAIVDSGICAAEGKQVLLTTDPAQLERGHLRVYMVRNSNPAEQLKEVLSRFDLGSMVLSGSAAYEKSE